MSDWSPLGGGLVKEEGNAALSSSKGANIVASSTANTKGAWYQFVASTGFDADMIHIWFGGDDEDDNILLDVGVGGAGSEQVILPDLHYSQGSRSIAGSLVVPMHIPAGTRLSGRAQAGTGSMGLRVGVHLSTGGFLAGSPLQLMTAYGADTSDSGGALIDPGATINTKGAWTQMVASSSEVRYLYLLLGNREIVTGINSFILLDVGVGAAASEQVIVDNLSFRQHSTETLYPASVGPIPVNIPAGSRIAIRAQSDINDATGRLFDAVVYGVA